jgi:uncharacterized protein YkwD
LFYSRFIEPEKSIQGCGPRFFVDMKNCGRGIGVCLLISFGAASLSAVGTSGGSAASALRQESGPAALETRLFDLTNEARQKFGLKAIRYSPELAAVACRHCSDMAGRDVLSHVSSSGASLEDRLVGAGFYFSAGAENVSRSFSAPAEEIHRALMRSPEHSKNILDPKLDTIGIGAVVTAGGVIFVTEDFLEALVVLDHEAAREQAAARIQEIRRERSLQPLVWDKRADILARDMAKARAEEGKLPPISPSLGEVHVLFVVSPRFEDLAEHADEFGSPRYADGGLGVAFGRSKEARGGAYFISLVLLPGPRGIELSDRERGESVRAAINKIRQAKGLPALAWRPTFARDAAAPKRESLMMTGKSVTAVEARLRESIFSYETVDLGQFPGELETKVCSPLLIGVGVSVTYRKTRGFPRGAFTVTVAVK